MRIQVNGWSSKRTSQLLRRRLAACFISMGVTIKGVEPETTPGQQFLCLLSIETIIKINQTNICLPSEKNKKRGVQQKYDLERPMINTETPFMDGPSLPDMDSGLQIPVQAGTLFIGGTRLKQITERL